ncbi:unnamed protein product [Discula destructiva]
MPPFSTKSLVSLLSFSSLALAGVLPILPRQLSDAIGTTRTGQITYYNTLGGTGACGQALSDSEALVAVSSELYDQFTEGGNSNDNSLCGKKIQVTSADGTKTAIVTIMDRCTGCAMWDLDVTPTVFNDVVAGGEDVGRTGTSWQFVD